MRVIIFLLKATLGSIISKIISICVMAFGSLYLMHATDRLAPVMHMAGIESDGTFGGAIASIGSTLAERTGALEGVSEKFSFAALGIAAVAPVTPVSAKGGLFEVTARISDVSRECRLLDLRGARVTRTQPMPCGQADEMVTRAEFEGFEVRRYAKIGYIYYAPDGKTVINGYFSPPASGSREFFVGSVIDIEVNAQNPELSRPI